jgi:preprotein translocase subunit SecG
MYIAVMILHSLICLLMIALILFQRSEGGGLASSSTSGLVSARGRANLLTRTTGILAGSFFATSLLLTFLAGGYTKSKIILDPLQKSAVVRELTTENLVENNISEKVPAEDAAKTSAEDAATLAVKEDQKA